MRNKMRWAITKQKEQPTHYLERYGNEEDQIRVYWTTDVSKAIRYVEERIADHINTTALKGKFFVKGIKHE